MISIGTATRVTSKRTVSLNTQRIAQNVLGNLSCRKQCNIASCVALFFLLLMSGGHLVLYIVYGRNTKHLALWIFLVISIMYFLQFIRILFTWKPNVTQYLQETYKLKNTVVTEVDSEKNAMRHSIGANTTFVQKLQIAYRRTSNYYDNNFDINGKYYLYILYIGEFTETFVQCNNLIAVYLCTLPFGWNVVFAMVLIFESTYRTIVMSKKICSVK